MQVEIWSDVVCPWCYLGKRRFEKALSSFPYAHDVDVVHRSFELDPLAKRGETVATTTMLSRKYGMSVQQAVDAQRQMAERAAADGLVFDTDGQRSGSTHDAHRLLQLARGRGRQAELLETLFRAHFTRRRSIFDHDSLCALAVEAGLDAAEAQAVLRGNAYDDAVDSDVSSARALGATGVPFFVIDRRFGISGAQPAEVMSRALEQAWSAPPV